MLKSFFLSRKWRLWAWGGFVFIIGSLLYFSASIVKRSWDGELNLKINEVYLLSDVADKLIKEIVFMIPLDIVNQDLINNIESIIQKYPGKHNLKLNVFHEKVFLNFLSKKYQVRICADLINDMSCFTTKHILK